MMGLAGQRQLWLFKASVLLLVVLVPAAQRVHAGFQLKLTPSGGSTTTVSDNTLGDLDSTTGLITYSKSLGVFKVSVTTGTSKPVIGSATAAIMDLSTVDVSAKGPGSLTILLTDTDFSFPGGATSGIATSTFSGHLIPGSGSGSFSFQSFVDNSNHMFGMSGLSVLSTGLQSGSSTVTTEMLLSGHFSMTEKLVITAGSKGGSFSLDGSTTVVAPEPSSIVIVVSAIPVLAATILLRRRWKRA